MIEEHENQETILDTLIERVERDDIPCNIFDKDETDPLVLLGKMNEIVGKLKELRDLIVEKTGTSLYVGDELKETYDIKPILDKNELQDEQIQAINQQLDDVQLAIEEISGQISDLETLTVTHSTDIETLKSETETHSTDIETLNSEVAEHSSQIGENAENIASNASDIVSLKSTQGSHTTQIINLTNQMAGKQNKINSSYASASNSSTYVNAGGCYYLKIGNIVFVNIANVQFKNVQQTHETILFSNLPKNVSGEVICNLTCYGGTHQTIRLEIRSNEKLIRNYWSGFTPSTSQWWSGFFYYETDEI